MNYTFEFTEAGASLVLQALAKLPFESVAPLINDLQQQAAKQNQPASVPSTDEAVNPAKE